LNTTVIELDYWHQWRQLRLQGTVDDDVLPFAREPFVIANVVRAPQPLWRSGVASLVERGVPEVFEEWSWHRPLPVERARELSPAVERAVAELRESRAVTHPSGIPAGTEPDIDAVLTLLAAVRDLLRLAVADGRAVETWVE
jgi:hypothetical protein